MRTENRQDTDLLLLCTILFFQFVLGKSGEGHLVTQGHELYPQTAFTITEVLLSAVTDLDLKKGLCLKIYVLRKLTLAFMFFPQLRRCTRQRSRGSQHHRFIYKQTTNRQSSRQQKMKTKDKLLCTNGNISLRNSQEDNKGKTKRRLSDTQAIFFFSLHSCFGGLFDTLCVALTHSVAPSTFSLSFSIKRISHSQNSSSIGLALCDSDALTDFDTNSYSVESHFFPLHSSIKHASCTQGSITLHLQPVQQRGEHH